MKYWVSLAELALSHIPLMEKRVCMVEGALNALNFSKS